MPAGGFLEILDTYRLVAAGLKKVQLLDKVIDGHVVFFDYVFGNIMINNADELIRRQGIGSYPQYYSNEEKQQFKIF